MPQDIPDWTQQHQAQLIGRSPANTPLGDTSPSTQSADSAVESITTTPGIVSSGGVLCSFKAAAGQTPALVGNVGAILVGSTTSVSPLFGQATVAGHLLACWVRGEGSAPTTAAAGWVQQKIVITSAGIAAIWARPNCGNAEAAPVFTCSGGADPMVAQLIEVSGIATASPLDQSANASQSTPTSIKVQMAAVDSTSLDLVMLLTAWLLATPAAASFSQAMNNNMTAVHAGDTGIGSRLAHSSHSFGFVPAGSTAQPLGVAEWDFDATGTSAPAAGTAPSVVLAAVAGKTYHCGAYDGAVVLGVATALTGQVTEVLDGVTVMAQHAIGIPAAIGNAWHVERQGLGYKGTVGASMTSKVTAVGASNLGTCGIGAYLR